MKAAACTCFESTGGLAGRMVLGWTACCLELGLFKVYQAWVTQWFLQLGCHIQGGAAAAATTPFDALLAQPSAARVLAALPQTALHPCLRGT